MSNPTPVVETSLREAWARAYARQARSDWEVYELLVGAPRCHQLHYLQMASEKIAKAYRFRDTSTATPQLLSSHVGFTKFFNSFLLSDRVKQRYEGKVASLAQVVRRCRRLASELEKLAPAVDRGNNPANPEYAVAARVRDRGPTRPRVPGARVP